MKSKLSLYSRFCHISSALPFRVFTFVSSSFCAKSSIAFSFFHTLSIPVKSTFLFIIAKGKRGKPPPVHISATFHSSSINIFSIIESIKCFSIIQLSSLIALRFI
ncbi:MAG: hypothetical protein P1U46_02865 [Patescibacteria group bacterium]|nr:hypothetical protein [Patescibacteria group bacterium]